MMEILLGKINSERVMSRGIFSLIGANGYARPISNHVGIVALLQKRGNVYM